MLDQLPAGNSTESLYSRVEAATDAWFASAELSLRRSARRILRALIMLTVVVGVLACLVIGGVGMGVLGGSHAGEAISPEQATETYGSELFHIQLTAQAKEYQ